MRAAAERAGCDVALALADVHETWSCEEEEERWRRRRRRHGSWSGDEDEEEDEPVDLEADGYELGELQDWTVELRRWIAPSGDEAEPVGSLVGDEEVCSTTPSRDLEPYKSEYEGYMGNWGNTMDRWYHRGALVAWPRERTFALKGEASPQWALGVLVQRIRAGEVARARTMAESLAPFWSRSVQAEERRASFEKALQVAAGLDDPVLAASLLQPFRLEALTPASARSFAGLVERYGEGWTVSLLGASSCWRALPGRTTSGCSS